MMSYNMQAISGDAPALTHFTNKFGAGGVHGVGPLALFIAFVFYPNGVIIRIYIHAIRGLFDQWPGRVVYAAGMPGGIGFINVLMHFAVPANSIMRRYLR